MAKQFNIETLRSALESVPIFFYSPVEVKDIQYDPFEATREKFAADLGEIKKANAEQLGRMDRQHEKTLANAREGGEKEREEFVSRMERSNADHQQHPTANTEKVESSNRAAQWQEISAAVLSGLLRAEKIVTLILVVYKLGNFDSAN